MNHLKNGTTAVGAPGSKMRKLAEELDSLIVIKRTNTYRDGRIEHYFPIEIRTLEYWLNAHDEFVEVINPAVPCWLQSTQSDIETERRYRLEQKFGKAFVTRLIGGGM